MKLKNIFRMLLVAVGLLMGTNNVQAAETTIWSDGTTANYTIVQIGGDKFANVTEGTKLRIYATIAQPDNWAILIQGGWSSCLELINWNGADDGKTINNSCLDNFYNGTYFEMTLSAKSIELLQQQGTAFHEYGVVFSRITLVEGSTSDTTTHTLTIVVDGQSTTQQVAEGAALASVLTTPTKEGYTFTEWEGMTNDGNMPANDLTVTAQFSINSYTLTYQVDGEQYGDVETIEYGAAITPRTEPTKDGYTFTGWQNMPATMPANDVVVTGSFTKDKVYTSISVGSTGYASYCSDKALNFTGSEAVKAYIAKSKSDTEVTLQQVTGAVAPNTGLILCGNSNASANIEVVESGNTYSANLLVGVMSNTTINASNLYVLVNKNGTIKFADTAAQAATVPAGKAYLQTPASNSRMLAVSFENTTTAIKALKTGSSQGSEVYNLNGQRVKHVSKGLYIINGKKVIIK